MRVIDPGHVYGIVNVDGDGEQVIRFVRRRDDHGEPLADRDREPGILTQELLRVAIDRTLYLYAEAPCDEDTRAGVLRDAGGAAQHREALPARGTAALPSLPPRLLHPQGACR